MNTNFDDPYILYDSFESDGLWVLVLCDQTKPTYELLDYKIAIISIPFVELLWSILVLMCYCILVAYEN